VSTGKSYSGKTVSHISLYHLFLPLPTLSHPWIWNAISAPCVTVRRVIDGMSFVKILSRAAVEYSALKTDQKPSPQESQLVSNSCVEIEKQLHRKFVVLAVISGIFLVPMRTGGQY